MNRCEICHRGFDWKPVNIYGPALCSERCRSITAWTIELACMPDSVEFDTSAELKRAGAIIYRLREKHGVEHGKAN